MIAKKSNKADLERKRFAFFQIGLVVAGSLTLAAFEYTTVSVEKKKVAIVDNAPVWGPSEELLDEDILESKPQPQKTTFQTEPVDDVTISTKPSDMGKKFTPIIVIDDPCEGCEEDPKIVDDFDPNRIVLGADVDPSFPGGETEMIKFLQKNVSYPTVPREIGEQGIVYVEFVVNTDGSICQVKSQNQLHPDLLKEAERVVNLMPNWIPGEQAGKKVRVRYTIPINFVIR